MTRWNTEHRSLRAEELLACGVTVPLIPTAAQVFGLSDWLAYDLARRGEFPVPVRRIGQRLFCNTADLLRAVGLTPIGSDPA